MLNIENIDEKYYKVVIQIDIDKEQFDAQNNWEKQLILADIIYNLAEDNELDFQMIDKSQKALWKEEI